MDDLVTRLRRWGHDVPEGDGWSWDFETYPLAEEAAREIENLRGLGGPQLQNIKDTLLHFGRVCCFTRGDSMDEQNIRNHLAIQGLSEDVVNWVVS